MNSNGNGNGSGNGSSNSNGSNYHCETDDIEYDLDFSDFEKVGSTNGFDMFKVDVEEADEVILGLSQMSKPIYALDTTDYDSVIDNLRSSYRNLLTDPSHKNIIGVKLSNVNQKCVADVLFISAVESFDSEKLEKEINELQVKRFNLQ